MDVLAYGLREKSFTPATFSNEKYGETLISTSIGKYIVIWSLNRIKAGKKNYMLYPLQDTVVKNEIRYNTKDRALVTLPGCLKSVKLNSLVNKSL